MRTVAQIPARVKYLVAVAEGATNTSNILDVSCFAFTCSEGRFPESLISSADVSIVGINPEGISAGDLFKDLGRQLVVCDAATDLHTVVYREVQRVNGAGVEGVPSTYSTALFVRVWAASGLGVRVARTGPGAH